MGVLRFVLAFAVFGAHSGFAFANSRLAVQTFFMISGFLISYVLNKDVAYGKVTTFYVNRALRIFPVYWVVLAATLLVLFCENKFGPYHVLNAKSLALIGVSNVLIFGQDVVMFVKQQGDGIAFAKNFNLTNPQLWQFLILPPAWSLPLELTFYLLAPFLVRRMGLMVGVALGSVLATAIGWRLGFDHDPWTYRFFPFELSLFLAGALGERLLLPVFRKYAADTTLTVAAPFLACAVYVGQFYVPQVEPLSTVVALMLLWALMPVLFLFQHDRRWDVFLGNLSFPLYICHWTIVSYMPGRLVDRVHHLGFPSATLTIPIAILCAILLERFVARPVELLRKRIRAERAPVDALEAASVPYK